MENLPPLPFEVEGRAFSDLSHSQRQALVVWAHAARAKAIGDSVCNVIVKFFSLWPPRSVSLLMTGRGKDSIVKGL